MVFDQRGRSELRDVAKRPGNQACSVRQKWAADTMREIEADLLRPVRFYTATDIVGAGCAAPAQPGIYAWYFNTIPGNIDVSGCHVHHGRTLLYVGISPSKPPTNGKPPSSSTVRRRLQTHFGGNASGSTLRLTLGCLLADELGIQLRRVGSGGRYTFTNPGERRLDDWMAANAFVVWHVCEQPWKVEEEVLASGLPLPLNISGNPCAAHSEYLLPVRRSARLGADQLPVISDNGGPRRVPAKSAVESLRVEPIRAAKPADQSSTEMSDAHQRLRSFLTSEMRMSHIYQPVMLKCLLSAGGSADRTAIARAILEHDPSQVEYYEQIVQNMVGRVLTAKRDLVRRDGRAYYLIGREQLSDSEKRDLISICEDQIDRYLEARGKAIWEHRRRQGRLISGSVRYEVLKRARFRCELCGTPADEKALEVDHIIPRNHGGSDDIINLQALCYTCNAAKRDRDDTDLRGNSKIYDERETGCLFCEVGERNMIAENRLAFVRRDGFPVTELHTLVIPKRHVSSYFNLSQPELNAIHQLLAEEKMQLAAADRTIVGFNIGMNDGAVAGQTIMHCHVHLIPRRAGDVAEPRGGVRHVIPGKGNYESKS
ncbi:HIT domain-containing protein [Sphingomonas sp. BN140010]|uniref:HIT domain-containing protein n=1 Tax=Sphingomonas arvum TaxID=2992113 RepID=A0ABT3JEA0_9SPHN|nr:HIT domain-containing protein [Sphingomonas sp. BN140010]MCW3797406.1 HIT domain-containing protein [Sphingomonas sp. BN140010]